MSDALNTLVLVDEDGEELELMIVEKTKFNGKDYILAADSSYGDEDAEEAECYVFRDDSLPEDEEAVYAFVENEDELSGVLDIFQNLMEEVSIED